MNNGGEKKFLDTTVCYNVRKTQTERWQAPPSPNLIILATLNLVQTTLNQSSCFSWPNKTGFKQISKNTDLKCIKTENLIGKMRPSHSVVKVLLQVELSAQTKLEEVSEDQEEVGGKVGAGGSGLWTLSSPLTNMRLCLIIKCLLSCPARQSRGPPKIWHTLWPYAIN